MCLKTLLESVFGLSLAGSAFQTVNHAKENARSANLVRVCGLTKVLLSEEHRLKQLTVSLTSSCRYTGAYSA